MLPALPASPTRCQYLLLRFRRKVIDLYFASFNGNNCISGPNCLSNLASMLNTTGCPASTFASTARCPEAALRCCCCCGCRAVFRCRGAALEPLWVFCGAFLSLLSYTFPLTVIQRILQMKFLQNIIINNLVFHLLVLVRLMSPRIGLWMESLRLCCNRGAAAITATMFIIIS